MVAGGRLGVVTVRGEELVVVAAGEMMTGTAWDESSGCAFWTWSCAVAGKAMLLAPMTPESVFVSTTEVVRALPFQRMTDCCVKLVPVTCSVALGEPAMIVFGRTALILGRVTCWTRPAPQPMRNRKMLKPVVIEKTLIALPKIHPKWFTRANFA
jgi:hypothetical protein